MNSNRCYIMGLIEALELALQHVRGYHDRMFLQFLISVERRKQMTIIISPEAIEATVDQIRDWELDNGEGFTDYFLDRYSYGDAWLEFLEGKGFTELVKEIKEDVYVCQDGTVLGCTDQGLKFEPHISAHGVEGGDWDEDIYRKDVALWAEFILTHEDIYTDYVKFLEGDDD